MAEIGADERKCPKCGSDKWRNLQQCFDCGHKQFIVPLKRTRKTDTPTWQWGEHGKKEGGKDENV